jgi:hypothetical protein
MVNSNGARPGCRRPTALPTRRWLPRMGLTLALSWELSPPGASLAVLTGRATHVP